MVRKNPSALRKGRFADKECPSEGWFEVPHPPPKIAVKSRFAKATRVCKIEVGFVLSASPSGAAKAAYP